MRKTPQTRRIGGVRKHTLNGAEPQPNGLPRDGRDPKDEKDTKDSRDPWDDVDA